MSEEAIESSGFGRFDRLEFSQNERNAESSCDACTRSDRAFLVPTSRLEFPTSSARDESIVSNGKPADKVVVGVRLDVS
jgi:hypothetical protein